MGGVAVSAGKVNGVVRVVLAGGWLEVLLRLPVFDTWAMRDDDPPKRGSRIFTFCNSGVVSENNFISRLICYY